MKQITPERVTFEEPSQEKQKEAVGERRSAEIKSREIRDGVTQEVPSSLGAERSPVPSVEKTRISPPTEKVPKPYTEKPRASIKFLETDMSLKRSEEGKRSIGFVFNYSDAHCISF